MAVLTLEEGVDFVPVLIPDDTEIPARVVSVQIKTLPKTKEDGSPIRKVEFCFELLDPQYDYENKEGVMTQKRVYGSTSDLFSTSSYSKLRSWATEIMGLDELPVGFALDTDVLVGQECVVVVEINSWEDKKASRNADGSYPLKSNNRVKDVLRSSGDGFAPDVSIGLAGTDEPF